MKVEVKKVDSTKRELKFEIPRDRVTKALDEIYSDIGRYAKVKGFRPGKVPRPVLESHHGKLAQEEVIKKLIPEVYHEGIKKENITPIDLPEIHDVSLKDGIITFTAKLDIKPDVKVADYKGIKVTRKSSEVTDEDVNKTLDFIKQGKGKDKEVTIDDAFANSIGYPNLEEFKRSIKRQLEIDKDRHNRYDVENQIVEFLISKAKLTVPQSLITRQTEHRVGEALEHWKQHKLSQEEMQKKEEQLRKDLKEPVERDVKVYLILDKIAELEKIEAKEGENLPAKVMEYLLKEAKWS